MKKSALGTVAVALALPFLVGCGDKPTGNMTGSVSYKGKPVVMGTVTVYDAQSRAFQGGIADGKYHVANVTEGPVTIIIISHNPNQGPPPPPAGMDGKGGKDAEKGGAGGGAVAAPPAGWFALPKKYEDAATTTLKTTVKAGENPYDLTLTD